MAAEKKPKAVKRYAILVVWNDCTEEHVMQGDHVAVFHNRREAQEQRDFIAEGIEGHQSISVVEWLPDPPKTKTKRGKR